MKDVHRHAVEMARSDNLFAKIFGQLFLRVISPNHDIAVDHKGLLLVQMPERRGEKHTTGTDYDRVPTTVIGAAMMLSGLPWAEIGMLVRNKPEQVPTSLEKLLGEDGSRILKFIHDTYATTRINYPGTPPDHILLNVLVPVVRGHLETCTELVT